MTLTIIITSKITETLQTRVSIHILRMRREGREGWIRQTLRMHGVQTGRGGRQYASFAYVLYGWAQYCSQIHDSHVHTIQFQHVWMACYIYKMGMKFIMYSTYSTVHVHSIHHVQNLVSKLFDVLGHSVTFAIQPSNQVRVFLVIDAVLAQVLLEALAILEGPAVRAERTREESRRQAFSRAQASGGGGFFRKSRGRRLAARKIIKVYTVIVFRV